MINLEANPRAVARIGRERLVQLAALALLLLIGALAIVGPSGMLAWGENLAALQERKARIAALEVERDELQNRVALLDPAGVDPDIATELLRSNMNVVHPDEVVLVID